MKQNHPHRTFFNSRANEWDSPGDTDKLIRLKNIFQKLDLNPQGNILDAGAGTGILVPVIYEVTRDPVHLIELDFSEAMLKRSKQKYEGDFHLNLHYINADAQRLPFSNQSFQWIIAFAVLPHVSDKRKVIQEWYRVLASNGTLLILHLMGSKELNQFHSAVGGVIAHDHLPAVSSFAETLQQDGYQIKLAIDQKDLYLIHAVKE